MRRPARAAHVVWLALAPLLMVGTLAQAGREYVELARNSMGEVIMATPAISDGVIVVRTLGHIWGIGPSRTIE